MGYMINVDGKDVFIETSESSHDNRAKLLEYYLALLESNGTTLSEDKQKALNQIVENMPEASAESRLERQKARIMAYAKHIMPSKEQKMMAEALEEVIDATVEDEKMESVLINGNKFLYEPGTIDVDKYAKKLHDIGEETKGNTWTIYTSDDGELVIY